MNATLFEGGKVHRLNEAAARCGVGKPPRRSEWQMDWGEATCRRCHRLADWDRVQREVRAARASEAHGIKAETRNPKSEGNPKPEDRRRNP